MIPYQISNKSIVVLDLKGVPHTLAAGSKRFLRVRKALLDGDATLALELMDIATAIESKSVGAFRIRNGVVRYGNTVLNSVISEKLLKIIMDGDTRTKPIELYVQRILKNPSAESAKELYDFLGYRELPITPQGTVLAWKGVQDNYYSVMGNPQTKVLKGKVDSGGHIWNGIGEEIRVDRDSVDPNRANCCSFGLHLGSFDFARTWGQKLILVEFDPADAVSVPKDCNCQKLRVCAYKVIADMTGAQHDISDPVVYDLSATLAKFKRSKKGFRKLVGDLFKKYRYDYNKDSDCQAVMEIIRNEFPSVPETDILASVKAVRMDGTGVVGRIVKYLSKRRGKTATIKEIQSAMKRDKLTSNEIVEALRGVDCHLKPTKDGKVSKMKVRLIRSK